VRPIDRPVPQAVDLVDRAMSFMRSRLSPSRSVEDQMRDFWAGVVAARNYADRDIIEDQFVRLAREVGRTGRLGRRADEDIRHVIRWALHNRNPF
jgi:hypothetical protein